MIPSVMMEFHPFIIVYFAYNAQVLKVESFKEIQVLDRNT